MTAIALTIAGSDSSGGAGIQADLKTFSALGVYGASAITALTAQNTQGVEAVLVVPPEFVLAQIRSMASDLMSAPSRSACWRRSEIIEAVVDGLEAFPGVPVVLDPVMVARLAAILCSTKTRSTRCAPCSCRLRARDHAEHARGRPAARRCHGQGRGAR